MIFILIANPRKVNMNPKLIKAVITDDDQVMMDGKYSPIGVMEEKILLNDPNYDVTISKHGLFRLGWQDRQGTPIGPQAPRPRAYDPAKAAIKAIEVVEKAKRTPKKKVAPVTPAKTVVPEVLTPKTVTVNKNQPPYKQPVVPVVKPSVPVVKSATPSYIMRPAKLPVVQNPKTPNPITPQTQKIDKSPPHSVAPIPNFNA